MKANELMIGDWVRRRWTCADTGREIVKDFQVAEIRKNWETLYVWKDGGNMGAVEQIEPIPLTTEILEKNGWEEIKKYEPYIYYLLKGKDYSISLSKEWDSTTKTIYWPLSIENHITDANLSVDYVHELQHALRLCGIDKEINL